MSKKQQTTTTFISSRTSTSSQPKKPISLKLDGSSGVKTTQSSSLPFPNTLNRSKTTSSSYNGEASNLQKNKELLSNIVKSSNSSTKSSSTSKSSISNKKQKNNQGKPIKLSKPTPLPITSTSTSTASSPSKSTTNTKNKSVTPIPEPKKKVQVSLKKYTTSKEKMIQIEKQRKETYDLALTSVVNSLDALYKSSEFAIVMQEKNEQLSESKGCHRCGNGTDIHAKVMSLSLSKLGSYFGTPSPNKKNYDDDSSYTTNTSSTTKTTKTTRTRITTSTINHSIEEEEEVVDEIEYDRYIQPSTFLCVKCDTEICYECIVRELLQHPNIPNSVGYRCPSCSYFNCNTIDQVPMENLKSKYYIPKLEIHHIIGKSYTKTTPLPYDPLLPFFHTLKPLQSLEDIAVELPQINSELLKRLIELRKFQQSNKRKHDVMTRSKTQENGFLRSEEEEYDEEDEDDDDDDDEDESSTESAIQKTLLLEINDGYSDEEDKDDQDYGENDENA